MSLSDERSKIERLLVLALSSEQINEALAARSAIKNMLATEGLDIHEFAARLRSNKLSKAEMQKIYDAGVQEGKDAAAAAQGFSSTEGPTDYEMAIYCVEHDNGRLNDREREFVEDMVRWCTRRESTERQGRWLHRLWVRLGRRR
jgi:hypothetical protein